HNGEALSPTGRSVGTAPQAIEPSASRKREYANASSTPTSLTSTATIAGPASNASRTSPAPHTCTPVMHFGAASAADNKSVAVSRSTGGSSSRQQTSAGSSKNSTSSVS